jgi:hypothetical protein
VVGDDPGHRGDVDDGAAAALQHDLADLAAAVEEAIELTDITVRHLSSGTSSAGMLCTTPALLTRMSMRPNCSTTESAIAATDAESVTSVRTKAPPSASAAPGPVWSLISAMTTVAPAAASSREIAKPRL